MVPAISFSEITPESICLKCRDFLRAIGACLPPCFAPIESLHSCSTTMPSRCFAYTRVLLWRGITEHRAKPLDRDLCWVSGALRLVYIRGGCRTTGPLSGRSVDAGHRRVVAVLHAGASAADVSIASLGWLVVALKLRRMVGLFAFFCGSVHSLTVLQFYPNWDIARLSEELVERPFITLAFSARLLMLPLAATSTRGLQRRLRSNWQRLHRRVYPAFVLACLHLL